MRSPREIDVGLFLFVVAAAYVIFDSIQNKKVVISENALRHVLDGLTFATGLTIAYSVYDASYFKIVATNGVYSTVTALTCIIGPLINVAERYDRLLSK